MAKDSESGPLPALTGVMTAASPQLYTYIFLMRHGETDANAKGIVQGAGLDPPLNEQGREQARLLGEALAVEPIDFDLVVSSTLARARETADIIADSLSRAACGPSPERLYLPELSEMRYGELEGKSLKEMFPILKRLSQDWAAGKTATKCPGGGESPAAVLDRALPALSDLATKAKPLNVLVVAHSRLNKILLSHLRKDGMARMHRVGQANASTSLLAFNHSTGHFEVAFIDANLSAHL